MQVGMKILKAETRCLVLTYKQNIRLVAASFRIRLQLISSNLSFCVDDELQKVRGRV